MRFTSAVLILVLLSLSPLCAQPRPPADLGVVRSNVEKVYYDVEGDSHSELAVQLRLKGPRARGGGYFGMTEWEVNAEYRWHRRPNVCSFDNLTIHVDVQTHLPRWRRSPHASRSLRGAWGQFLDALDRHERGHRALAEEAAEALRRRLASLRATTCGRLEARAYREMTSLLSEYERRHLAYDAETGHGRSQGAVWPPESPLRVGS